MEEEHKHAMRLHISLFALLALKATGADGGEIDLEKIVEENLAIAGIFHGLGKDEIWAIADQAISILNEADATGSHDALVTAVQDIKDWGFQRTALAVLVSVLFADGEMGETEGQFFQGMCGHLEADEEIQKATLLGVSGLLRRFY